MNDLQISNIVENLPSMMIENEWRLIYSLNRDGVSMSSFYERCKKWKYTIMVVQDLNGWVFGAYATERWHVSSFFYGTGETFLFTF